MKKFRAIDLAQKSYTAKKLNICAKALDFVISNLISLGVFSEEDLDTYFSNLQDSSDINFYKGNSKDTKPHAT